MGPFIADFACHGARLIVEVDGGVHRDEETAARDRERDAWLGSRDYRVLRVTNDEVFADMASVIARIEAFVRVDTPTPTPPRKGEGLYVGED